jgi:hypothetical protein
MRKQEFITSIATHLARFRTEVELLTKQNLYDINIHSENVLIPLLNSIFGLEFVNANSFKKNYPGIDLIDKANRVAVQVTSTATIAKVKHTLSQIIEHKLTKDFDTLFIYILTEKQSTYKEEGIKEIIGEDLYFDPKEHVIDASDLLEKLKAEYKLDKINVVADLLKEEFSDEAIKHRERLSSKQETIINEPIFPNVIRIVLPENIYIADLSIKKEEEIKKTWKTSHKLRKKASLRDVVKRSMSEDFSYIPRDWHVFKNKLISFRDLSDISLPFNKVVDLGTMEAISTQDFYDLNLGYLFAFKNLLTLSITEKLERKYIQWLDEDEIYRFKPIGKIPNKRRINWKLKNNAFRHAIDEILNKDTQLISYYKHLAFSTKLHQFNEGWYISINPTWSYTSDGYLKSLLETKLITGVKKLEIIKPYIMPFVSLHIVLPTK